MDVHDGHRERLKQSFIEHGLDAMNDITALELLLFYAVPRRDTNELAHRLLDRFENLSNVFQASIQELTEVQGIGENTAILLTMLPQMMKKSAVSATRTIRQLRTSREAGMYFIPRFINERDELMLAAFLNTQRTILCCCEVGRGVVNGVDINVRRIVEKALKVRASSVIVAHNHPNGNLMPSREDDLFTKRLYNSLDLVGIRLADHVIVSGDEYISIADTGMMQLYRF